MRIEVNVRTSGKLTLGFGLLFLALGFLFANWSGRHVHVRCERLESQFFPNCEVRETFLELIPVSPAQKIDEARGVIQYGRSKPEFLIKQQRGLKSLVALPNNTPATLATVPEVGTLREFFSDGAATNVNVTIADPTGNGLYATICFSIAAILLGWFMLQFSRIPRRPWDA